MRFTYQSYRDLIALLRGNGYHFTDYHHCHEYGGDGKVCILRHDIDNSVEKACSLFEVEQELGVTSTWFVLVTGNFYNPFSRDNVSMLKKMAAGGCGIGLHFDEAAYPGLPSAQKREKAEMERGILEKALDVPVRSVSMHRPSKNTLGEDWAFEHMVNSYSEEFFHGFKYLSDSRRRWREPAEEIIRSGEYPRLHILTHAFWYNEEEKDIRDSVCGYVNAGNMARYAWMEENITDLGSVMGRDEVR